MNPFLFAIGLFTGLVTMLVVLGAIVAFLWYNRGKTWADVALGILMLIGLRIFIAIL